MGATMMSIANGGAPLIRVAQSALVAALLSVQGRRRWMRFAAAASLRGWSVTGRTE